MYIIDCLPFVKSLNKGSLTYFSAQKFDPGTLVKVSVRGKTVPALVMQSKNAAEHKSSIRSADFVIKKISSYSEEKFVKKNFLDALLEISDYFACSQGSLLTHLIPTFAVENYKSIISLNKKNLGAPSVETKLKIEVEVIQCDDEERLSHYKSLIREEFAQKKSVFICTPQSQNILKMKDALGRGIESFVCTLHSAMKTSEIKRELSRALETEHPVLIIATAQWLFLDRQDLGVIVVEKENDSGWKTLNRPHVDLRVCAEKIAKHKKVRCILGDTLLRIETLFRYKQGSVFEFESVKWRQPTSVRSEIISSKEKIKNEKEYSVLTQKLIEEMRSVLDSGGNVFLYSVRKGLSPVTICRDCGNEVKCENCESPMVLHRKSTGNKFMCHHCGEIRSAAETCKHCGSWKLMALGAGTDRIFDEVSTNFPKSRIFEINKELTSIPKKAENTALNFYESKAAVLIGTDMALPYLRKKIRLVAAASIDPLFAIPDFRIREKIFGIIMELRDLARERFIVQTRNPEDQIFYQSISGNIIEFYKNELEARQALNYPPYGLFIKITVRGTRAFTMKESEHLKKIFDTEKEWEPLFFPSIQEKKGEQSAVNAVLKLERGIWPDRRLVSKLMSLPPHFEVKIDPDSVL